MEDIFLVLYFIGVCVILISDKQRRINYDYS